MSDKDLVTVQLTRAECRAVSEFYSFGATRGNHANHDGTGPVPGLLTPYIITMGNASMKCSQAASSTPPDINSVLPCGTCGRAVLLHASRRFLVNDDDGSPHVCAPRAELSTAAGS